MTTQAQQRAASARFYGFCLNCGGPKDKPPAKEPYRSEYERDPYCTRTCAEDDLLPKEETT